MTAFGTVFDVATLNGNNGFRLNGAAVGDFAGRSVASAGDFNGDGFDDMIVAAASADSNGENAGTAYVVFGAADGFTANMNLSALDGSNGFSITGGGNFNLLGRSVASAGDVNGDGLDDLIIGATGVNDTAGAAYVIFGTEEVIDNLSMSRLDGYGIRLVGQSGADFFGKSVASAGDVNNDGYDDVIIGAFGSNTSGSDSGAAYVVFGSPTIESSGVAIASLNGTNGFAISGEAPGDYAGFSVASAGDLNGDGFDDMIVGAYYADTNGGNSGATYVIYGKSLIPEGFPITLSLGALVDSGFKIRGEAGYDYSGRSVASAGDINGDGFDDLIIGAHQADPNDTDAAGAAYVVFGSATKRTNALDLSTLTGADGFKFVGLAAGDSAGVSVASAGDVNGDGYDDLIIGAYGVDLVGKDGAGASYVVFGKASGYLPYLQVSELNGANGFAIIGAAANDTLGESVASAGDINNDGYDDLIVGARWADTNGEGSGAAYVIFGKATSPITRTGTDAADSYTGTALNDSLSGAAGNDRLFGGEGEDDLYGGEGNDRLYGDASGDLLYGGAGGDIGYGGAGNDFVHGDAGNDSLFGGEQNDLIYGGDGVDRLYGDAGYDTIYGGDGGDLGYGGVGIDRLYGDAGNDSLFGGDLGDLIYGGAGRDRVHGGADDDFLYGDDDSDRVFGDAGQDYIFGGAGSDVLYGGEGSDVLEGGAGRDLLFGGADADTFRFASIGDMTASASTTDVIYDFVKGSDNIALYSIDASTVVAEDNTFTFNGTAAHGTAAAGEVYYRQIDNAGTRSDYTLVYIDNDADAASEAVIRVMGLHAFTASDFIL